MELFLPLLAARLLASLAAPIADCDEVFNFWEPLHYVMYGSGLEPWEYSPQHALRSWLYVWLHALLFAPLATLPKWAVFYGGRVCVATLSAMVEATLWHSVCRCFGRRVGRWAAFFSALSPAMFSAVPSILPTSFVLTCYMASHAAWISERRGSVGIVIAAAALAVVLGWPFAALVMVPAALDCIVRHSFLFCLLRCWPVLVLLGAVTVVDSVMYGRLVCSTWNLVWYNFLGADKDTSSELYGIEPWHFFLKNLALNFNVVFPLSLLAPFALAMELMLRPRPQAPVVSPTVPVTAVSSGSGEGLRQRKKNTAETGAAMEQEKLASSGATAEPCGRWLVYISPFFLWLVFWLLPAHKEERFLVPAYHSLLLSAAVAADCLLSTVGWGSPRLRAWLTCCLAATVALLSAGRILAQTRFYAAPLRVYADVAAHHAAAANSPTAGRPASVSNARVCVGKEWYRFPSHFLLHPDQRLFFLRSNFGGLLPTHFNESHGGSRTVHKQLNRRNQAVWDLPSIANVNSCQYVVDFDLPGQEEEHYAADTDTWTPVASFPFLDAAHSPAWSRWLYLPFLSAERNTYRPYVALHRRTSPAPLQDPR